MNEKLKQIIKKYTQHECLHKINQTGLLDSVQGNTLSFLASEKYIANLNANKNIVAVLVDDSISDSVEINVEKIRVKNSKAHFFEIHNEFRSLSAEKEKTQIASDAQIDNTAYISEYGVRIESGVVVMPRAVILDGVTIGALSIIGPGTVIGTNGFHCFDDLKGHKKKVIHDGFVYIGENVEIGANVVIDRGLMGRDTIIGNHTKLDNLIHIAHRAHIGTSCMIVAGCIISGSVNIGDSVWIGPGSVISNRITIGDNAKVLLGSIVVRNIKDGDSVSGNFAMDHYKRILHESKIRTEVE